MPKKDTRRYDHNVEKDYGSDSGKYWKNVESGRVPEKGSGKHRKRVRVSTENGSGRVPKKGSGKYKKSSEKGSVQVPKMVEFRQVPKKGLGEYRRRVRVSTEKGSG